MPNPTLRTTILSVRAGRRSAPAQRPSLEVLRTDSATFTSLIEAKRNRHDAFYAVPAGKVDLCGIDVPVRTAKNTAAAKP
jgi:hypothetical protein